MKLKIEHLNCHFGKKRVLDNLSLQVNSGEIIHLVGANGSGKSTLLKVIIGAVPFSQGKVILNPETYVGALIENPQFFEYQSARDNIEYLAKLRHHLDRAYLSNCFQILIWIITTGLELKNIHWGCGRKWVLFKHLWSIRI